MALTEVYVDPSIAASSGTGTIGDPYGDVQYALDTQTRDAVNGDRFNIKAGTDEILAASLDFSTYGTPTEDAPLVFQGYTASQGDGGIGGISGNGSFSIVSGATLDFANFIDMHLHNSGAADVLALDNNCAIINCEVDNGADGILLGVNGAVVNCYVHNCTTLGAKLESGIVAFNYLENGASNFTTAINFSGKNCMAIHNVISISGATIGINISFDAGVCMFNSIYAVAGTGAGIQSGSTSAHNFCMSNIVEGFSGVGGVGIDLQASSNFNIYGFNAFYNNTTNLTSSGVIFLDLSANDQALGASPFTNAGAGDFTVSTAVKALAYPTANYPNLSVRSYLDIGALQREEAAAAASVVYGLRRIPI